MRTEAFVARVVEPLNEHIHAARLGCLCRVIVAALTIGKLSLTALGRALSTGAKQKHNIKRIDALLSNRHLAGDAQFVQQHFATLMKNVKRPVLLIDWSDIGKRWTALAVTYVCEGRGLTLCWEVHPIRKKNSATVESAILKRIALLLPPGARPILITDAGYRGPWLQKVRRQGWDFIGRVRGRVFIRAVGAKRWASVKTLWSTARRRPTDLGKFEMARYQPVSVRLVSLSRKKNRKQWPQPLPRIGRRKKRNIKSAREPLILATSLENVTAKEVARLYALRWQIEMTFRDQKCGRFGLGLDAIETKKLGRARAYMLLAALTHYVAFIIGAAAERAKLAPQFQANTMKKRRVLSLPRLGCEIVRAASHFLEKLCTYFGPQHPEDLIKCGDP